MKGYLLSFFSFIVLLMLIPVAYSPVSNPQITQVIIDGQVMESEEYVASVVAARLDKDDPQTLYRALAIAVRSCLLNVKQTGSRHGKSDFCRDSKCCFGLSADTAGEKYKKAVLACRETEGTFLKYDSSPAMALWHESSGARTADCIKYPYLVSVANVDESESDRFETKKVFEYKEFSALLGVAVMSLEDAKKMCILYSPDGQAAWCVFEKTSIDADTLKTKLCLPSKDITLICDSSTVTATSKGAGHGYGMSINGARIMAKNNKSETDILKFYFPMLQLSKNPF